MQVCGYAAAPTALTTQAAQVLEELSQALPNVEVIANEGLDDDVVLLEKGVLPLLEDSFIIAQLLLFVRKMRKSFYFFSSDYLI